MGQTNEFAASLLIVRRAARATDEIDRRVGCRPILFA
jgi:hypothetical protein